jgi:folate-binding protein YgfZ
MVKRLSMFVMRAKLKISDASALYEIRGLLGETALLACPALKEAAPWHARQEGETYFVKLHNALNAGTQVQRLIWLGMKGDASSAAFLNQPYPQITQEAWQLAEVLSGISMVQTATAEAFVPQMLNYESVDGVSFKKGCYPGQEVVARSQFRGTLKRRAFIVSCPAPMHVGQEIFSSEDAEQACGMVSSAGKFEPLEGQAPEWWGIASLQLSATEHALELGQAGGPSLALKALPYPLLEDL